MYVIYDKFNRLEKPGIYLCNPDYSRQFCLDSVSNNVKLTLRYNSASDLTFTIPKIQVVPASQYLPANYPYNHIVSKKIIELVGVGYFIVTEVEEQKEGYEIDTKLVTAKSIEMELSNKKILAFGTTAAVPLHDVLTPANGLLGKILTAYAPNWTIGTVDGALLTKYRTFTDVNDTTVYDFLMNDVETTYGCVFIFDTTLKTVSAKAIATAATSTDIYISFDNLLKSGSLTELSDEITTVLYVYGAGDMDIRSVNPIGGNKIYNFNYYKSTEWMSAGLISAISAWESLIAANQTAYANLITSYKTYNGELVTLQSTLTTDEGTVATLQDELKVMINAGWGTYSTDPASNYVLFYAPKKAELDAAEIVVANDNVAITNKEAQITAVEAQITAINTLLDFETNFTDPQLTELNNFIFENTYQNNNFIQTDTMTLVEIQETSQELYDQGQEVLAKVALPRYEFTASTINFPFIKDYFYFTNQLAPGCEITIDASIPQTTNYIPATITTVVLEIAIDYDNPEDFTLSFSNRLRLDNGKFVYSDLVGQTVKTGTSVDFGQYSWYNWDKEYKGSVSTFITSALNATVNNLVNSTNQEIIIDQHGLRGRELATPGVPGIYKDEQCWLTSQVLAFTDDNWNTAKLALGKIDTPDGSTAYGIIKDMAISKKIYHKELII